MEFPNLKTKILTDMTSDMNVGNIGGPSVSQKRNSSRIGIRNLIMKNKRKKMKNQKLISKIAPKSRF